MLPNFWVLKWIPTDPKSYRVGGSYYRHGDGGLGLWENEKRAKMAAARGRKPRFGYWQPIEVRLVEIEAAE